MFSAAISFLSKLMHRYFWKFFWFNLIFFAAWSIAFPSLVNLVIMKQDFIFLIASSPFVWKYAIYWFHFFV